MKKWTISRQVFTTIALLFFTACDKAPQVFSLNNFTSELANNEGVASVTLLPVKEIEGTWMGMEHQIKVEPGSINNMDIYSVELIDTSSDKTTSIDTTAYSLLFISIAGHPFAEVISQGTKIAEHDFMLPVSTYLKINKLTPDTIIMQMPASVFTAAYMKANRYNYFIPAEYKNEKEFPVYITEEPYRLAELLNILCGFSNAFQPPDTLLRKH